MTAETKGKPVASLTVVPDPPVWSEIFHVNGSGFSAGASYNVVTHWPTGNTSQTGVTADSSGAFTLAEYAYFRGTYTLTVYSVDGHGNRHAAVASITFSVS